MSVSFTLGRKCSGGTHYTATMSLDGRDVPIAIDADALREPITRAEITAFGLTLARLVARSQRTNDATRTRLSQIRVDF